MSQSLTIGGTTYSLPTTDEVDWNAQLTAFFSALTTKLGAAILTFGSETTPADVATNFLRPAYKTATADTEEVFVRVPFTGRVVAMYAQAFTGSAGGNSAITVRKNAVNTAMSATLAIAATQGADTTNAFAVTAGDRLSVKVVHGASVSAGLVEPIVTLMLTAA